MTRLARFSLVVLALLFAPRVSAQEAVPFGGGPPLEVLPPLQADATLLQALAGEDAELLLHRDGPDAGAVRAVVGARLGGAGTQGERAIALLTRFASVFALPPDVRLEVLSEADAHGLHVVRLVRTVGGLPVMGTAAVVRFLPDGAIDYVVVSPSPRALATGERRLLVEGDAFAAARSVVGQTTEVLGAEALLFPLFSELVPVWAVDVQGASEASLATLYLDARNGGLLLNLPRLTHAMGTVFARNTVSDMAMTTDVELPDLTGTGLTGRYLRVASCNAQSGTGCSAVGNAVPDASGDFLYAPVEDAFDDAFAEVNAYHHASRAAAYFRDTHAFTWRCGASTTMEVLVNFSEAPGALYDNAAYSPGGGRGCGFLLFGEGSSGDFAWDGDVVYHEYGHAVTDELTDIVGFSANNLGVSYMPLAINEGTSDYWAGTLQGDGAIAESFGGAVGIGGGHGSLRVIDNMLTCPSDLIGEGHFDGRIFAALVWDVREAAGAAAADTILFATMPTLLSDVSLADAAAAFRATAMTLSDMGTVEASVLAAVDAAIAAHGLTDCDRVVPLDDGMLRQGYSGTESITGSLGRNIAPNHYRIDIPVDATSLTLRIGRQTFAGSYTLHVRSGAPVRVASRIISSFSAPLGNSGDLVLSDAGGAFVLPRCQTLYIAVQVDDLTTAGQSLYGIQSFLTRSGDPAARCPELPDAGPPPGTDAGVAADAGTMSSGGGCACSAAAPLRLTPGVTGLLLGLFSILLARRARSLGSHS